MDESGMTIPVIKNLYVLDGPADGLLRVRIEFDPTETFDVRSSNIVAIAIDERTLSAANLPAE